METLAREKRTDLGTPQEIMAEALARARETSDDPHRQVGAALVLRWGPVLFDSNRFTRGIAPTEARTTKPLKYHYIEHAERNVLARAHGGGYNVFGAHMYLPWFPCSDCARAIVLAGVAELYCYAPSFDDHWADSHRAALEILKAGQVNVIYVTQP